MQTHAPQTDTKQRQAMPAATHDTATAVAPQRLHFWQARVNHSPQVRQAGALQRMVSRGVRQAKGINYDAGVGALWHVHIDHVKYNGDNGSRINFAGRSKTYIKREMERYHNTLAHDPARHHSYLACRKWVNKYL